MSKITRQNRNTLIQASGSEITIKRNNKKIFKTGKYLVQLVNAPQYNVIVCDTPSQAIEAVKTLLSY